MLKYIYEPRSNAIVNFYIHILYTYNKKQLRDVTAFLSFKIFKAYCFSNSC